MDRPEAGCLVSVGAPLWVCAGGLRRTWAKDHVVLSELGIVVLPWGFEAAAHGVLRWLGQGRRCPRGCWAQGWGADPGILGVLDITVKYFALEVVMLH